MNPSPSRTRSTATRSSPPLVRDFMTAAPHTIGRQQSLSTAQERMRAFDIRHLPVLEGGRLAGILSQRDAYFIETLAGVDPSKVAVEEAMSIDVYAVPAETPLTEVATTMAEHKYGCALVIDGHHIVGIFTMVDALRALVACATSPR